VAPCASTAAAPSIREEAIARGENEQTFAWEEVSVGADDQSLTLTGVHSAPYGSSSGTWWTFSRAIVEETDEAVRVRVIMVERRRGTPGAMRSGDPVREIPVILPGPLAGRVVVDGCARLVQAQPDDATAPRPTAWHRVRQADDHTLVVYWHGGRSFPLDHVSAGSRDGDLVVTVWVRGGGGRLAGAYYATIVHLEHPVAGRRIIDGAVTGR
jgi:hypothetical protein